MTRTAPNHRQKHEEPLKNRSENRGGLFAAANRRRKTSRQAPNHIFNAQNQWKTMEDNIKEDQE